METTTVLALIVGAACTGGGVWLGTELAPTPPILPATSVAAPSISAELLADLVTLRDEVTALRDELEARRTSSAAQPSGRVDTSSPAEPALDCGELLAELRDRLRALDGRPPAPELVLDVHGALREQLFQRGSDSDASDELEERWTRDHMLWTYQRVLDHYGKPDRLTTESGSLCFVYEDSAHGLSTFIHFVDGYATNMYRGDD